MTALPNAIYPTNFAASNDRAGVPQIRNPKSEIVLSFLSRRPTEHASAKQVQVDVIDRLARARIHIEYGPVALLMDARLHRQLFGDLEYVADQHIIFRHHVVQRGNVLSGTDQKVHRRLRSKVFECHQQVILIYKLRRSIVSNDSTEQTCLLHVCNLTLVALALCTSFTSQRNSSSSM